MTTSIRNTQERTWQQPKRAERPATARIKPAGHNVVKPQTDNAKMLL